MKKAFRRPQAPGYLRQAFQPLAKQGYRLEWDPKGERAGFDRTNRRIILGGYSLQTMRTMGRRNTRVENLSALRHEMGHEPVGSKAYYRRMHKMLPPRKSKDMAAKSATLHFAEEMQAWANAMKVGKGRVSTRVRKLGLTNYASAHPHVYQHLGRANKVLDRYQRMMKSRNKPTKRRRMLMLHIPAGTSTARIRL